MLFLLHAQQTAAKLLKGYVIITPISLRYRTSNHQFATFDVLRKTMKPTFLLFLIHYFIRNYNHVCCCRVFIQSQTTIQVASVSKFEIEVGISIML